MGNCMRIQLSKQATMSGRLRVPAMLSESRRWQHGAGNGTRSIPPDSPFAGGERSRRSGLHKADLPLRRFDLHTILGAQRAGRCRPAPGPAAGWRRSPPRRPAFPAPAGCGSTAPAAGRRNGRWSGRDGPRRCRGTGGRHRSARHAGAAGVRRGHRMLSRAVERGNQAWWLLGKGWVIAARRRPRKGRHLTRMRGAASPYCQRRLSPASRLLSAVPCVPAGTAAAREGFPAVPRRR